MRKKFILCAKSHGSGQCKDTGTVYTTVLTHNSPSSHSTGTVYIAVVLVTTQMTYWDRTTEVVGNG